MYCLSSSKTIQVDFPVNTHESKTCFDLLHCDVRGPYNVSTHNGKRCFVTLVEDFSGYTWTFVVASKTETLEVLKKVPLLSSKRILC